jgi:hypothetical protein
MDMWVVLPKAARVKQVSFLKRETLVEVFMMI